MEEVEDINVNYYDVLGLSETALPSDLEIKFKEWKQTLGSRFKEMEKSYEALKKSLEGYDISGIEVNYGKISDQVKKQAKEIQNAYNVLKEGFDIKLRESKELESMKDSESMEERDEKVKEMVETEEIEEAPPAKDPDKTPPAKGPDKTPPKKPNNKFNFTNSEWSKMPREQKNRIEKEDKAAKKKAEAAKKSAEKNAEDKELELEIIKFTNERETLHKFIQRKAHLSKKLQADFKEMRELLDMLDFLKTFNVKDMFYLKGKPKLAEVQKARQTLTDLNVIQAEVVEGLRLFTLPPELGLVRQAVDRFIKEYEKSSPKSSSESDSPSPSPEPKPKPNTLAMISYDLGEYIDRSPRVKYFKGSLGFGGIPVPDVDVCFLAFESLEHAVTAYKNSKKAAKLMSPEFASNVANGAIIFFDESHQLYLILVVDPFDLLKYSESFKKLRKNPKGSSGFLNANLGKPSKALINTCREMRRVDVWCNFLDQDDAIGFCEGTKSFKVLVLNQSLNPKMKKEDDELEAAKTIVRGITRHIIKDPGEEWFQRDKFEGLLNRNQIRGAHAFSALEHSPFFQVTCEEKLQFFVNVMLKYDDSTSLYLEQRVARFKDKLKTASPDFLKNYTNNKWSKIKADVGKNQCWDTFWQGVYEYEGPGNYDEEDLGHLVRFIRNAYIHKKRLKATINIFMDVQKFWPGFIELCHEALFDKIE